MGNDIPGVSLWLSLHAGDFSCVCTFPFFVCATFWYPYIPFDIDIGIWYSHVSSWYLLPTWGNIWNILDTKGQPKTWCFWRIWGYFSHSSRVVAIRGVAQPFRNHRHRGLPWGKHRTQCGTSLGKTIKNHQKIIKHRHSKWNLNHQNQDSDLSRFEPHKWGFNIIEPFCNVWI